MPISSFLAGALPTKSPFTQLKIIRYGSNEHCAWVVVCISGKQLTVTPELAEFLLNRYPSLALHACKSGGHGRTQNTSATFGNRLVGALLPHAAEHVAIELLVQDHPGEIFAGNTKWVNREKQLMRVRISLPQTGGSERALSALSGAIRQLNELLVLCQRQM